MISLPFFGFEKAFFIFLEFCKFYNWSTCVEQTSTKKLTFLKKLKIHCNFRLCFVFFSILEFGNFIFGQHVLNKVQQKLTFLKNSCDVHIIRILKISAHNIYLQINRCCFSRKKTSTSFQSRIYERKYAQKIFTPKNSDLCLRVKIFSKGG